MSNPFRYFNSSPEIIHLKCPLSLRNVEDLLAERGIDISHETVRFWWNRFGPMFAAEIRKRRVAHMRGYPQWRWHLDEAFVKVNGKLCYLWRAVDHEGEVLEAVVTAKRDKAAALKFLKIALSADAAEAEKAKILSVPWTAPSPYRRREIIQGANNEAGVARPMPHGARVILIEAISQAHRWLDKLLADPNETVEAIASRVGKTERSIRMTLSLAFLAPDIVKAAIDGRPPRGFGLKRLIESSDGLARVGRTIAVFRW